MRKEILPCVFFTDMTTTEIVATDTLLVSIQCMSLSTHVQTNDIS